MFVKEKNFVKVVLMVSRLVNPMERSRNPPTNFSQDQITLCQR